jgi:integration host factor subunit alpha
MPGTLTKIDIVSAVQTQNRYTLKESSDIVNTLLEILKSTLASGEDVLISGFGRFQVKNNR